MSSIKVFKTISGDEVVGQVMDATAETGTFRVEYPLMVDTMIDPTTKYAQIDLLPWLFGATPHGPYHVAAQSLAVLPQDPKPFILHRYREVVEQITQQAEAVAQATRSAQPMKPTGRKLGGKK